MTKEQEEILIRSLLLMKYTSKKTFSENLQEVAGNLLLEWDKPVNDPITQNAWDFIQSKITKTNVNLGVSSQVASSLIQVGWTDAQESQIKQDKDTLRDILDSLISVTVDESKIVEDILNKYSKKYIMFDTKEYDAKGREIYVAYPAMEYLRAIYADDESGDNLRADLWAAPGFTNDTWKKRVTEIFQNSFIDWIEETNRIKNSIIFSKGVTVTECKDKNRQYYEDSKGKGRCVVSEKRYYEIINNNWAKGNFSQYNFPFIPVEEENLVYALFAVWVFQSINEFIYLSWGTSPKGRCLKSVEKYKGESKYTLQYDKKYNKKTYQPDVSGTKSYEDFGDPKAFRCTYFPNGTAFLQNIALAENPCVCYNEYWATEKPWQNLKNPDLGEYTQTAGKLNANSFSGNIPPFIPAFSDINKTYGTLDFMGILKSLDESKKLWVNRPDYAEEFKTNENKIWPDMTAHDWLMLAQIATFFIPVAGPWISLGLNVVDAALYFNEKEFGLAALTFGLGLVFDIPGIGQTLGQFGKSGIKQLTNEELQNIARAVMSGNPSNLSLKQLEFVREYMNLLKAGKLQTGLQDLTAKYADEALAINGSKNILSQSERQALEKYSKKQAQIGGVTKPVTQGGPVSSVGAALTVGGAIGFTYDIATQASDPLKYIIDNLPKVINEWYGCNPEDLCYEVVFKYFGVSEPYFKLEKSTNKFLGTEYNKKYYLVDYVNLAKAWEEGWRPISKRTRKEIPIPEEYQTETYKKREEEMIEQIKKEMLELFQDSLDNDILYKDDKTRKKSEQIQKKYSEPIDIQNPEDTVGMNITPFFSSSDFGFDEK